MDSSSQDKSGGAQALLAEIRRALENADIEALADLYAEDAVLEEVSSLNPPSHPCVVKGREEILKRLKKDLLRDPVSGWERHVKSSRIVDEVETDEVLAFVEVRTFEAGDQMIAQHIIHKKGGRIEHDRVLVAWDAAA